MKFKDPAKTGKIYGEKFSKFTRNLIKYQLPFYGGAIVGFCDAIDFQLDPNTRNKLLYGPTAISGILTSSGLLIKGGIKNYKNKTETLEYLNEEEINTQKTNNSTHNIVGVTILKSGISTVAGYYLTNMITKYVIL